MANAKKQFEFLEHTADVLVRAYGKTLEEALANIAQGMFEIITSTYNIEPQINIEVYVCGYDLENLVYRWLEELLYYHDAYNYVFGKFDVKSVSKSVVDNEEEFCVHAYVYGEKFDMQKHEPRTVVKAVTYHQMQIRKAEDMWIIEVVFDI